MSNYGLENFLKKEKIKFFRSKVGDRYVKEKMKKLNFNLVGEQSGHIILGKFASTGDGLMVALEVLFSLRKGKKASKLLNVFVPMPQILENITVKEKNIINKFKCKSAIKKANKLMSKHGRLLIRKSGTEPKIRIMGESYNKKLILRCIKLIKRSIK
jgi:phosphoglucosamine mutase